MREPFKNPRKGSLGRKIFWLTTATLATDVGVSVYASKNEEFRKTLESYIPQAKPFIDTAGDVTNYITSLASSNPLSSAKELPSPSQVPSPIVEIPKAPIVEPEAPPPPPEPKATEPIQPPKEKVPEISYNIDVSSVIKDIEGAVKMSKDFVQDLYQGSVEKIGSVQDTMRREKIVDIEAKVSQARELISKALADSQLPNRDEIQDKLHQLDDAVRNLNLATLEAEAYKLFSTHFHQNESKTSTQDESSEKIVVPLDVSKSKIGTNEMNQFVEFGYQKLKQLQEELAKHENSASEALKTAISSQKSNIEQLLESKFAQDFQRAKKDFEDRLNKEIDNVKEKLDAMHKNELDKQSAVHSQQVQDVLQSQETYLRSRFETEIQEALVLERSTFRHEMAMLIARVEAIRKTLDNRSEMDKTSSKSHQLWIASQALHDEVFSAESTKRQITVSPMIKAIESSFGNDPMVASLTSQLDKKESVPSQADLTLRFDRLKGICRRVAFVPDPPKLSTYLWSYLKTALMIDPPALHIQANEKGEKFVDAVDLDNLTILTTAQKLIENNEFELGVRFVFQIFIYSHLFKIVAIFFPG